MLHRNFELSAKLLEYFLRNKIGIIDYPCPELTVMGLMRNPQGRMQYDNVFFREHCAEIADNTMQQVKEFINHNYSLIALIGIENSPSCSINWGKHKINKYNTESPNVAENDSGMKTSVMGIITDEFNKHFQKLDLDVPFLELPVNESIDSERGMNFWIKLKIYSGCI
jgi:predicted secreted protein